MNSSHHVEPISERDYAQWQKEHTVLEKDRRGPKVMRCGNGDFIKIFRIKRAITLSRVLDPAHRFCDNARYIAGLGIPTLVPTGIYRIPHLNRWAVRYVPLAGETVRDLIKLSALPEPCIVQIGQFIADLHEQGVYFRSLHPGNIVLTPDGKLGLIDVLDCSFRWFGRPLSLAQRKRNFNHFFRYEDGELLRERLLASYTQISGVVF
jgi:hypothetical protein